MSHIDISIFLFSISMLIISGALGGMLARYFRFPTVIGEIIAGLLLGPSFFGLLFPSLQQTIFPVSGTVSILRTACEKIGMLFVMFIIGLELDGASMNGLKKTIVKISTLGFFTPFIFGIITVYSLPSYWNISSNNLFYFSLLIGTLLSISALAVIGRILMDLHIIGTQVGSIILSSASLNDLFGWSLFAILLTSASSSNISILRMVLTIVFILVLFLMVYSQRKKLSRFLIPYTLNSVTPYRFAAISAFLIAIASGAEIANIHAAFGALLVGIVFSERNKTEPRLFMPWKILALGLFAPLYFVSVGLKVHLIGNLDVFLVMLFTFVASLGKFVGVTSGALLSRLSINKSLAISTGMNARGAVNIILSTAAYERGLFDQRIYIALLVMILITTIISGPLMQKLLRHKPIVYSV